MVTKTLLGNTFATAIALNFANVIVVLMTVVISLSTLYCLVKLFEILLSVLLLYGFRLL